jgi:tetratricopeptide (TPR) repeat protein
MVQWIQGYGLAPDDLRMVVGTFRTAFPNATMWSTAAGDNLLVGSAEPIVLPLDRIQARFDSSPTLREDFARVGLHVPMGLLADFMLPSEDLARYAERVALNTDDTLPLEFSAPRSLYEIQNAETNNRILRSYRSKDLPPLHQADLARAQSAEGREAIGRAYVSKGLLGEAETQFTKAGQADAARASSRMEEARLLIRRGRVLPALETLEQVLARNGRDARAHFLTGTAYQQQGMSAKALAKYTRAVELDPDTMEYRLQLGHLLRDTGDLEKAKAEYEVARRLQALHVPVLSSLAEISLVQARPEEALAILQPILSNLQQHPTLVRGKIRQLAGNAHLVAKRFGEAIAALEAAVHDDPLNGAIRWDLSRAYEESGDLARAVTVLDRLVALQPNHTIALQRLNALQARLEARAS